MSIMTPQEESVARRFGRKMPICPLCGSTGHSVLEEVFDDRYGCPDAFSLVQCNHCDHIMTSPQLEESELGGLYSSYYPRRSVVTADLVSTAREAAKPLQKFNRWLQGTDNQGQYWVRPGQTILDVGCGSGLSLLEARNLGADAYGVEADPNVARIAAELGLNIHIGSLHDEPFPGKLFDIIVLNQVIEHIPEPGLALLKLKNRLAPGGRIVLVFPNIRSFWCRVSGRKWINWHIPYHLHHFSQKSFERLATRCGFAIRRSRAITPNLWTLLQIRAMRQDVQRGQPAAMWGTAPSGEDAQQAQASVAQRQPSILKRLIKKLLLVGVGVCFALLNRTLDVLNMGDSLMVEIEPAS